MILFYFIDQMTCFWDGILLGLKQFQEIETEFKQYTELTNLKMLSREKIISFCETHCKILGTDYDKILWNGKQISLYEMETHHIERILHLEGNEKTNGYYCGSCDSFLLFICVFFKINIHHKGKSYNNKDTQNCYYYNDPIAGYKNNRTLYFKSNKKHFEYVSFIK